MHRRRLTPQRPLRVGIVLLSSWLTVACGSEPGPPSSEMAAEILRARSQGLALLQQDRLAEARGEFERLVDLAPGEAAGPANLALVALREGRLEEALGHSDEAIERDPDDPVLRIQRGVVLEELGRDDAATEEREIALELDSANVRALWALAGGSSDRAGFEAPPEREERLERVLDQAPGSLPARFELVDLHLEQDEPTDAAIRLEELRTLVPEFPLQGESFFDDALTAARAGEVETARGPADRLHDAMRLDPRYQAGLERLRGPLGEATGLAMLAFSNELRLDIPDEAAVLEALRFRDASEFAGLMEIDADDGMPFDLDGDGDRDLLLWRNGDDDAGVRLLRNDLGRFVDVTPADLGEVTAMRGAVAADVDSDGFLDLYLVREGPNRLYRNLGDGTFDDVSGASGAADGGSGLSATFVDLDHDADLDLVVGNVTELRIFRNDGGGGFERVVDDLGVGDVAGVRDVAYADVDDDSDIDLIVARGEGGVALLINDRQDRLRMVSDPTGTGEDAGRVDDLAVGDLDNDGFVDVVAMGQGRPPVVYRGSASGSFSIAPLGVDATEAELIDVDNDGALDLMAASTGGLATLHNSRDGSFADLTDRILASEDFGAGVPIATFDYNEDGDLDLLVRTPQGVRLLRNDGGNLNHHVTLDLVALGPGSGKVNRFGVGSLVELRAGELYQVRTVRGPRVHFGLGSRLKADVIRIVWTNGVPQYLYFPGTDQELIESQELKGSCAFVYAWNGEGFEFVTDATWRSALGMPVGIMGTQGEAGDRIYAPGMSSREYLRIPGDRLVPRDGRYTLQFTEELWEVAYMDEIKLLAVDHPDSIEVFVDEKFVPPAPPRLTLYRVARRIPPAAAVDHHGSDLTEILSAVDDVYVSDFGAGPYQGLTEPHAMVLEVPQAAFESPDPHLFLQGWIFPADASINVAVGQRTDVEVQPNRLQVPDGQGGWRTAIADIGFPSGKNKVVVVDLGGIVDPHDPRIRITGNTQVYWDHAFFATGGVRGPSLDADAESVAAVLESGITSETGRPATAADDGLDGASDLRVELLRPATADLHERGFSRQYRKGGRFGPHWFDYEDVREESPWLPIRGRYTRYGEVGELLLAADDRYVVMAPGDEMTVDFVAERVEPPTGWTRTFLLYTDGWIKDADLNTATGHTVEPLPFQAQTAYPYGAGKSFPDGPEHRAWLEEFQTRVVDGSTRGLIGDAGSGALRAGERR